MVSNDLKKCPKCAELIKSEASKCRYCGHEFGFRFPEFGCVGTVAALIVLMLIMSQCEQKSPEDQARQDEVSQVAEYKFTVEQLVKARLRDPSSATFRHISQSCGYVNSRNGFGGMTGDKPFIIAQNNVVAFKDDDPKQFAKIWKEYCEK